MASKTEESSQVEKSQNDLPTSGLMEGITTSQIMEAIRLNPFEEKFREANRCSSHGELSSPFVDVVGTEASGSGLERPARKMSRKLSGANAGLSLKLPPTLTSQSPGFFSNVSVLEEPDPNGLETPEIARLVRQVREDSRRKPPGTAEVLNAMLDIDSAVTSSTLDIGAHNLPELNPISVPASVYSERFAPPSVVPSTSRGCSAPNPAAPEFEPISKKRTDPESCGPSSGVMLAVRVGNQLLHIPLDVSVTSQPLSPQTTSECSRTEFSNQLKQVKEADSSGESPASDPFSAVHLGSPPDSEHRRRDTLERNKAAAVRYRKRKKEEFDFMQDKVRRLEEDKLELSTQVTVLKRELERMSRSMAKHRNCNCTCDEQEDKSEKAPSTSRLVVPRYRKTDTPSTSAVPYVIQPMLMPTSVGGQTMLLTSGNAAHGMVVPVLQLATASASAATSIALDASEDIEVTV